MGKLVENKEELLKEIVAVGLNELPQESKFNFLRLWWQNRNTFGDLCGTLEAFCENRLCFSGFWPIEFSDDYCIFKWNGLIYKLTYEFNSYNGADFDSAELNIVVAKEKLITVYE